MNTINSTTRPTSKVATTGTTWRSMVLQGVRAGGLGMLAGLIGGILWGVAARIAMRVIAVAAHQVPEFHLGATLLIVLGSAFVAIPLGLTFPLIRRYGPRSTMTQGCLFGTVVLMTIGTLLYHSPPFQDELTGIGRAYLPLTVVLFGALLVAFGVVVALVYDYLDHHLLTPAQKRIRLILGVGLLLLPILLEVWFITFIFTGGFSA